VYHHLLSRRDGASAKFSTSSHETDNSVGGQVYGWVDKKTDKSQRVGLLSCALRDARKSGKRRKAKISAD
jgi:hypothetical protein